MIIVKPVLIVDLVNYVETNIIKVVTNVLSVTPLSALPVKIPLKIVFNLVEQTVIHVIVPENAGAVLKDIP